MQIFYFLSALEIRIFTEVISSKLLNLLTNFLVAFPYCPLDISKMYSDVPHLFIILVLHGVLFLLFFLMSIARSLLMLLFSTHQFWLCWFLSIAYMFSM